MMLIVLMSCLLSLKSYAEDIEAELEAIRLVEPELDLGLQLPPEKTTILNGENIIYFSLEDYKVIAAIYANYIALADENIMLGEELYTVDSQLESCLDEEEMADKTITKLHKNSDRVLDIMERQVEKEEKDRRRRFLVGSLAGGGGVIVGVAAGLLIGLAL